MDDTSSQNHPDPNGADRAAPSDLKDEKEPRGFAEAYEQYFESLTSLRAFASELNPAVQDSARKANSLVAEATTTLIKSWGFSSLEEFRNSEAAQERMRAATNQDPKAVRAAIVIFSRLMKRATSYFPHEQIMLGGVLMSLIGAFEVLLSDILHLYYQCYPNALESEEKNYSLKDIRSFKSLDDFSDHVIENKIDAFLRGSLADWVKFFQLRKIDMVKFVPSWESFAECFQRRHIVVHNGGRVSRQYLERVGQDWIEQHKEEAKLGATLLVSNEYLSQAFTFFELVGALLSQECWKRFARDERDERGSAFCSHQYECLVDERWIISEALGSWAVVEGEMNASHTLVARINRWLSIKRQDRWSEIEAEVMAFDRGVLDPRYVAAIHALEGANDSFFLVLQKAGIPEDDLLNWPILKEMREDPRFKEFLEKNRTDDGATYASSPAKAS
jgi:hypothetical protein